MEERTWVLLVLLVTSFCCLLDGKEVIQRGRWQLLKKNLGISAMHMVLIPDSTVIVYDRIDAGSSNISLPGGKCIIHSKFMDCYAHSVEFNPHHRSVRSLTLHSETWCSSGALSPDGVLIQSGGDFSGQYAVRYFMPWVNGDWHEDQKGLISPRWYASNQILPNGKVIVVGGREQFNYEFVPKTSKSDYKLYQLPFLEGTKFKKFAENNLYPFTHLAPDGNLFIFAANRAILLDYINNKVIRNYPAMPPKFVSRNYPSTGSSVLLPLVLSNNYALEIPEAEVFICGGTWRDSFFKAQAGKFQTAMTSCGRLKITDTNPTWKMEEMPINRIMGDMLLLPTRDVLIINGAASGSAGWELGRNPVLNPVLYHPNTSVISNRFEILNPSTIPRVYHSTALLIPDGRVLVAGSNPHKFYNFTALFPTELRLEAFYPPYFDSGEPRPIIITISHGEILKYNQKFSIKFYLKGREGVNDLGELYVTMLAPSFSTHSFSMNQRLLVLGSIGVHRKGSTTFSVDVISPGTAALAPPGYYLVFVVHEGVPSRGSWVRIR